jgi:putative transposase
VTQTIEPMAAQIDQQQLAQELVEQARADGVELMGRGGLLTGLTKSVLETALETEMSEHLGYDKPDPMGCNGGNSRNGTRPKTVLTEIGPVEIEVPRDRDGTFEPAIVRKRQRAEQRTPTWTRLPSSLRRPQWTTWTDAPHSRSPARQDKTGAGAHP